MSSRSNDIQSIVLTLLLIGFGIVTLWMIEKSGLDIRWLYSILILLVGFLFIKVIDNKELFLLRLLLFLIPYQVGFFYLGLVEEDAIFAFDVIMTFLYLQWLVNTKGWSSEKLYVDKTFYPALLTILWSSLAIPFAVSRVGSVYGVFILVKVFLIYFYMINRIRTEFRLRIVVNFLLINLGIQGTIGMLQKFTHRSLGLTFLGEQAHTYYGDLRRVIGTFGFPNMYGVFLSCLLPLAISHFVFTKQVTKKILYAYVCFVSLIALFYSLSRQNWFGLLLGMMVMFILLMKKRKVDSRLILTFTIIVIAVTLIAIVFWDIIALRFETGEDGTYRIRMIQIALKVISRNLIVGVGLYNHEYHTYSYFKYWKPVHNEYLRLMSETGVPGAFFFFLFVGWSIREAYRVFKLNHRYLSEVAMGIIGGLTAYLGAVMFGPQFQHYRQYFTFWILCGLAVALKRIYQYEKMKELKMKNNFLSKDPPHENFNDR